MHVGLCVYVCVRVWHQSQPQVSWKQQNKYKNKRIHTYLLYNMVKGDAGSWWRHTQPWLKWFAAQRKLTFTFQSIKGYEMHYTSERTSGKQRHDVATVHNATKVVVYVCVLSRGGERSAALPRCRVITICGTALGASKFWWADVHSHERLRAWKHVWVSGWVTRDGTAMWQRKQKM